MNLDLLIKLIRLANKNPNENEANSAARKVTQMLMDEKGNLIPINGNSTQSKSTEPVINQYIDPKTQDMHIIISQISSHSNPRIMKILYELEREMRYSHSSPPANYKPPSSGSGYWEGPAGEYDHEKAERARRSQERYAKEERAKASKMEEEFWKAAEKAGWDIGKDYPGKK